MPMTIAMMFIVVSTTFHLPPGLLSALCFTESSHEATTIVLNDGHSHSYGICQIKLETARDMGYEGTAAELMQPKTNIYYAAKYLANRVKAHSGDLTRGVCAYNTGSCHSPSSSGISYVRRVFKAWKERR
jgi:hypothetical protein